MLIPLKIMDQQFLIWFTGFYEGEGSVSNDKSNNNRIKLSVSQNDQTPLIKAKDKWGGSIRKRERKSPASDKICICYEWRLSHNESLNFIDDIKKYMMIPYKINQIEEVLLKFKNGNNETYKCNFCDSIFANPSGRRRHELNQHINIGVKFKCKHCNLEYDSKDSLNRHLRLKHNSEKLDNDVIEID